MYIGRDVLESYNYFHHYVSKTLREEYFRLRRCIEFGKELLKFDLKDVNERAEMNKLHSDACAILENAIPEKPIQNYSWSEPATKQFPCYYIFSDSDGGKITATEKEYVEALEFFKESQFATHSKILSNIESRIFHMLTKYEVVLKEKPTFKEVMEKTRIENYKKRHGVK
jgi:hypothetical protein